MRMELGRILGEIHSEVSAHILETLLQNRKPLESPVVITKERVSETESAVRGVGRRTKTYVQESVEIKSTGVMKCEIYRVSTL